MFKIQACSKLSERSMEDARQSHRKLGPIDEEWTQVFLSYREAVGIDDREAVGTDEGTQTGEQKLNAVTTSTTETKLKGTAYWRGGKLTSKGYSVARKYFKNWHVMGDDCVDGSSMPKTDLEEEDKPLVIRLCTCSAKPFAPMQAPSLGLDILQADGEEPRRGQGGMLSPGACQTSHDEPNRGQASG